MKDNEQLQCWIHHTVAMTGGYLGIYAILCRGDFFGNAQTSNLIYLVHSLVGRDFPQMMLRVGALLLYMIGTALTVLVKKKTAWNSHVFSLFVTSICIYILGLLPEEMNVILALYPIFFCMAVQWNSFPGAYGYASSTIFSTNNVRQFSISMTDYALTRDKQHLHRALFFGGTLLFFHIGVAFSIVTHHFMGIHSVWLCYLPLAVCASLVVCETSPLLSFCRQKKVSKEK